MAFSYVHLVLTVMKSGFWTPDFDCCIVKGLVSVFINLYALAPKIT